MNSPHYQRPHEVQTALFHMLEERYRTGSVSDDAAHILLRAFEIHRPREPYHLEKVGLRIPFEEIPQGESERHKWETLLADSRVEYSIERGYIELSVHRGQEDTVSSPQVDLLEQMAMLILCQKEISGDELLSQPAGLWSSQEISPPYRTIYDWKRGLRRDLVEYSDLILGDSSCQQAPTSATVRFPVRIPPSTTPHDRADILCNIAAEQGLTLSIESDTRSDLRSLQHPRIHEIGSILTVSAHFTEKTRDREIEKLVSFANSIAQGTFAPDTLWDKTVDGITLGIIPTRSPLLPHFPLWIEYCPRILREHLPYISNLRDQEGKTINMYNESPLTGGHHTTGRAWIVVPDHFWISEYDEQSREESARSRNVALSYQTAQPNSQPLIIYSVTFDTPAARTRALLNLFQALNAIYSDPPV
ncbi:hypothetical protein MRY87_02590 [bacterium]|nr:hypothetical protein [bacterium]